VSHVSDFAAGSRKGEDVRHRLRERVDELLGKCNQMADRKRAVGAEAGKIALVAKKPAAPVVEPLKAAPETPVDWPQTARAEHRALVLEGNLLHRKVLVRALERSGYEVDVPISAAEAIEAFQRCPYGVVLLDCDDPEMDGFRTAASLRLIEGDARHTPIVGLTSNAGQAHRKERKAAGIDNYLLKPFRRERVDAVVSRYAPTRGSGPAPALSALDKDRVRELQELAGDDAALLEELIQLFLTSAPAQLAKMRQTAEDEDVPALRRAAHGLKGSSGQIGALRLQEICGLIEALAGTGSLVGIDALLAEASLAFERAVGELKLLATLGAAPSHAAGAGSDATADMGRTAAKPNEILMAEDDMLIARFLSSSLTAAGFHVTHVRDGNSAIETLRAHNFAVVILDINMPEADGYQVLAAIRSTVGESTPVAIISSRHQEQDILRAFDLGVDDYLTKPFNPSEVVARVRRLARQAALRA